MRGTVVKVRPELHAGRLRVLVSVKSEAGEVLEAQMPDREVAAILPRSVLLGESSVAPLSLLDTVSPILARMSEGRTVRVWQYRERWFLSFQPWRSVRFADEGGGSDERDAPGPATGPGEGLSATLP
jgi:hypothetical protein